MPFSSPTALSLGLALLLTPAAPLLAASSDMPAPASGVAEALSLTDVTWTPNRRGPDMTGTLPDGSPVEIDFSDRGPAVLYEIEAGTREGAPLALVAGVLPAPIVDQSLIGPDAIFYEIDFDDDDIEIDGRATDGRRFEAEFTHDGTLIGIEFD